MPFKRYITTQFKYNNSSSRYDLVNIYLQRKRFRCIFVAFLQRNFGFRCKLVSHIASFIDCFYKNKIVSQDIK